METPYPTRHIEIDCYCDILVAVATVSKLEHSNNLIDINLFSSTLNFENLWFLRMVDIWLLNRQVLFFKVGVFIKLQQRQLCKKNETACVKGTFQKCFHRRGSHSCMSQTHNIRHCIASHVVQLYMLITEYCDITANNMARI